MFRRLCFWLSVLGMVLVVLAFAAELPGRNFVSLSIGVGAIILGVFGAIESIAKGPTQQK